MPPCGRTALGDAIRDARVRSGLNGRDFAAKAGISQQTLVSLEKGRPVMHQTIIRAADALGWPPNRWREILHGSEPEPEPQPESEPEIVIDVDPEQWAALDEPDREYVRSLIRRLADGSDG